MRKIIYNSILPEEGDSLLANFYQHKMGAQFSDARENAARRAFKVGHPNGLIKVPGKRGWIYVQRMLPGGDSTVLQCFVPSMRDGKTRVKFTAGQAIAPDRTNDTNPTYWMYDRIPPSTKVTANHCYEDPCTGLPTSCTSGTNQVPCTVTAPDGTSSCRPVHRVSRTIPCCIPDEVTGCDPCLNNFDEPVDYVFGTNGYDVTDLGIVMSGGCGGGPGSGTTPSVPDGTLPPDYDYYGGGSATGSLPPLYPSGTSNGEDGYNQTDSLTSPVFSPTPPPVPLTGELWFDGVYTRRFSGAQSSPTGWDIVQGPTEGEFFDVKTDAALIYGTAVYKKNDSSNEHAKATTTNSADSYGKVVGIIVRPSAAAGKLGVVQASGIAVFHNSHDPGTRLFIGDDGRPTNVVPASGTGKMVQQIATVMNDAEILIELGTPIIRA